MSLTVASRARNEVTDMSSSYLRRYMNLPALIYTLRNRSLTLLNPNSWDDSNDSYYMGLYRQKKELKTILAACFSEAEETYHHWKVFAEGVGGVCVRFDRARLLKLAKSMEGVSGGKVKYRTMKELESESPKVGELPFLKRAPYINESEYRLIFESKDEQLESLDIEFSLTLIDRVTLSPWMNYDLFIENRNLLKTISGCSKLEILRSTLIGNQEWKEYGDSAE